MKPISSATSQLKSIRLVASDMDGTMTENGKFSEELFGAFSALREANVKIILVTGRSAGWVNGLASLLPIDGAIAENGGIFFPANIESAGEELISMPLGRAHQRHLLRNIFLTLQHEFPNIAEAPDNYFRITDWTYSVHNLSNEDLARMNTICTNLGWDFTYSNVQCHITPRGQNKATGLQRVLANNQNLNIEPNFVLTIGDSPNDESLFDPSSFPNSVGVANIQQYISNLRHTPTFITTQPERAGFCEMAEYLIKSKL
jgi:HAD superfamily hydrolase (TIGR01484 family)